VEDQDQHDLVRCTLIEITTLTGWYFSLKGEQKNCNEFLDVVEPTHLIKYARQIGSSPQGFGVKIKKLFETTT